MVVPRCGSIRIEPYSGTKVLKMKILQRIILTTTLLSVITPYVALPLEALAQVGTARALSHEAIRAEQAAAAAAKLTSSTAAAPIPPAVLIHGTGPLYVSDVGARAEEVAEAAKDLVDVQTSIADDILDVLDKVILQTLKKRLLDMVVDQVIGYIQGEGEPRFITDWQGFFGDIAGAAVGDLAQALGLGFLCSPFSLQLRLSIGLSGVDRFKTRFSCTLDQIVGNIENFYEDFRNGGWIALNTSWQPQNNFYGSLLLAWDEQYNATANKLFAAANEVQAGGGFLDVKKCDENGENCVTVTPGRALGDLASKAIGSDIDFIVEAEDLGAYIAAIADALINRVIREGVGLAGVSVPSAPQRIRTRDQAGNAIYGSANLPGGLRTAVSEYNTSINSQVGLGPQGETITAPSRDSFLEQMKIIRSIRAEALTALEQRLLLEESLLSQLKDARDCQATRGDRTPHGRYAIATLGASTKTDSYWAGLARTNDTKVATQETIVKNLKDSITSTQKVLDQLSATISEVSNLTEAEFVARGLTVKASAIIDAVAFRDAAKNDLANAQASVPPQIDSVRAEGDECRAG